MIQWECENGINVKNLTIHHLCVCMSLFIHTLTHIWGKMGNFRAEAHTHTDKHMCECAVRLSSCDSDSTMVSAHTDT